MVPEKVRNIVLVGHGGSGKTTLAEALLYVGGATNRMGSVEQGTTTFDHEPEEIERQISLSLAVATVEWKGTRINIIDTPGSSDFVGDARSALRAADLALFCVSAVDGVEVQTEQLWRAASEEGIPRAVVITKDREVGISSLASYCAIRPATEERMVIPATVCTLSRSWIPEM